MANTALTTGNTPDDGAPNSTSLDAENQLDSFPAGGEVYTTGPLVRTMPDTTPATVAKPARTRRRVLAFCLILIALLCAVGSLWAVRHARKQPAEVVNNSVTARFAPLNVSLEDLAKDGSLVLDTIPSLSINGQVKINNSLVISPSSTPTNAVPGQIYYNPQTNTLRYFNGTAFVDLTGPEANIVSSVGGLSGEITVGGFLTVQNGQLVALGDGGGVSSVQGLTGNVNFTSGGGIAIDGTTLTNTGVTSLGGQGGDIAIGNGLALNGGVLSNSGVNSLTSATPSLVISDDGSGNLTITSLGGGSATVSSPGGTSGKIAKFTGSQVIADSIITDNGTTVSIGGDLQVSGSLTLGTLLSVANGGTGAASLANNGVLVGQGTSPITSVTAAGTGLCLVSTAGAPAFQACPGSGGVTSLNGLNGALNVANATASGSTITINDASTSQKGIAQFNSTNFTATSGTINTIQNIDASAMPTFAGVNATTGYQVNGTSGLASLACSGGQLLQNTAVAGGIVTGGSCVSAPTSGVTTVGVIDSQTKSANGAVISGTNIYMQTADATNPGLVSTGTQTFAGAKTFSGAVTMGGTLNVTGTLTANTITPTSALTVGATSQTFTLQGGAGSTITATSGASTTSLTFQTPGANVNYRLATASAGNYDLCTTTGNCVGLGGGLTGSGTNGTIAKFTGSSTLADSLLSESGSLLTANGSVNATTGYQVNGTSGLASLACSGGQLLQNATVAGGIVTSGSCIASGSVGSGVTTVGTIDSQTKSANGGVISGTSIYFQSADATNPGLVSTGTQTFAGAKTFNGAITASGGISGDGSGLTNLDASNISSGTLGTGRLSGSYTGITGTGALAAGSITSGFGTISTGNTITTTSTITGAIVNATTKFQINGVDGLSTSCSGGQFLQNLVSVGGIVTGGSCATPTDTTGVTTIGTIDSQTKAANGAVISGINLYLQTADATNPGLVSTGTQTFAGAKTFSGAVTATNASNSFGGDGSALTALNASNLASGTVANGRLSGSYTGITGTGALAAGSIASGFGTISTGNTIATTSTITGAIINATTKYQINGVDGLASLACSGGQVLQNAGISGGIITAGSCVAAGGSGVTTIGAIDSQIKSANGGVISGTSLYFQTADATNVGLVSTGAQTIAGAKTFSGAAVFSSSLTQSGGAFSLTGSGSTSSLTATSTSLNITAGAFSTWQSSSGGLTINAAGTSETLSLTTGTTGTIIVGAANTSTVTLGSTNNARTINVGANGTSTAQTVNVGSNGSSSTTNIRGGSGNINLFSAGSTIVKPTADTATAFQIQPSASTTPVLDVDTSNSRIGIGTNAPAYKLDVVGDINTSTGYRVGGTAGATTTCSGGQFLQNSVVAGGIVTSGSCATPTDTGVTTVGTIDSQTKSANGAVISGTTIYLQTADATNPGLVSTGTQTFAGAKTFSNNVTVSGTSLLTGNLTANGNNLFKTTANSSSAFQLQNAAGDTVFAASTVSLNNIPNGSFEQGIGGWVAKGSASVSQSSAQKVYGSNALLMANTASGDGAKYNVTLTAAQAYTVSFYARTDTSMGSSFAFGYSYDGSTETGSTTSLTNSLGTNTWTRFNFTFTPSTVSGTPYFFIKQTGSATRNIWVDGLMLANGSTDVTYQEGSLTLGGVITSPVIIQPSTNLGRAFMINDASGTNLFNADTNNGRIGISNSAAAYKLDVNGDINTSSGVYRVSGTSGATTTCSGGQFLQNSVVAGGIVTGGTCVAASNGVTTVGTIDSQTKSADGAVISGTSIYMQTADATNPGLVSTGTQTLAGAKTFSGNTVISGTTTLNNSLTQSGGAFSLTGSGSASSLTATSTALNITAGATSTWQTSAGNLSIQATASGATLSIANTGVAGTVQIGNTTGAVAQTINVGNNATGSSTTTTVVGSTVGASATTLQSGTGNITLLTSGGVQAVASTDSGSVFSVVSSTSDTLFNVDTANQYVIENGVETADNLLENPSFESAALGIGTSGWYFPGSGSIVNDGNARTGNQAFKMNATSTVVDGGSGKLFEVEPGDVYYMDGWVKTTGGANGSGGFYIATLDENQANATYTDIGGSFIAAPGGTYTRINGTVTVGAGKKYLLASTTVREDSTTGTWYFDDISLRKVNTSGPATIQTTTNTNTAFRVQDAGGNALFTVDTLGTRVYVGPVGGGSTGTLLVLGNKTSAGDPTQVDGAIYYNSSSKSFRCGANGGWRSCTGLAFSNTSPSATTISSSAVSNPITNWSDTGFSMLADECQPGTTYMITASGLLTDTSAVAGHVYLLLDGTSTTLATTPAKSFATSITNLAWEFNAQITCDTTGSSGTIEVQGVAHYPNTTTSWLTNGTSNTAALTFNTTTSHTLYMGWGWSTLSTGASVTLRQFIVQRLGPQ